MTTPACDISLERLRCAPSREAFLVTAAGSSGPERSALRTFIEVLTAMIVEKWQLTAEIFAQLSQFEGGKEALRKYREQWIPQLGLGVWPDRPPPTLWTRADFVELAPNEKLRPLAYQLLRISEKGAVRIEARNLLLDLASLLQIFTSDGDAFLRRSKAELLCKIDEPLFRNYPFYAPLLDSKSIESADEAVLEQRLCGAPVYIRSSREDNGVLLISRPGLSEIIDGLNQR